jgi:hypothetical protein
VVSWISSGVRVEPRDRKAVRRIAGREHRGEQDRCLQVAVSEVAALSLEPLRGTSAGELRVQQVLGGSLDSEEELTLRGVGREQGALAPSVRDEASNRGQDEGSGGC